MADPLEDLTAAGVSIWLDDLSRPLLTTGALQGLVDDCHVVGITTNPTIFANAVGDGADYDDQIRELGLRGAPTAEVLRLLTVADVQSACDALRPVYDTTESVDGRVSIEVDPRLAHDSADAITEARQLWRLVDRPNLFIKIPATRAALPAISQCLAEEIRVNVTLIFALQRYAAVIANARLAYEYYERVFSDARWRALQAAGAYPKRPLWASTGIKDPSYDDTRYVVDLVTWGVVNTMPQATLAAVADHGTIGGDTVRPFYADAHQVLSDIAAVGVDYDDVVGRLENDGLSKFEKSWAVVSGKLSDRLRATAPYSNADAPLPQERALS